MRRIIDTKDRKIIEILRKDARTPFTKIAKELGITEAAIRKRVKNMEERGVIKKYTAEVDGAKLGYNVTALTGVDTEPDKFLEIAKKLKEYNFTSKVYITSGDHMIMTEIWAKNREELMNILAEIGGLEGVKRVCPAIVLEKIK